MARAPASGSAPFRARPSATRQRASRRRSWPSSIWNRESFPAGCCVPVAGNRFQEEHLRLVDDGARRSEALLAELQPNCMPCSHFAQNQHRYSNRPPLVADGNVRDGLYESVITAELIAQIAAAPALESHIDEVDIADEVHVLTQHVAEAVGRRLGSASDRDERLRLTNEVLRLLESDGGPVAPPTRELLAMYPPAGPGVPPRYRLRPKAPLKDAALMTNAHGEPTLANELKAELDSADSVDLLCAFVMWRGVRLLAPALERVKHDSVPFRVLTTTYIGGTEREALDRLVRDYGAEVRVQYDAARTRLHAKAWLFRRDTGFDTAYVGSSNLSTSALLDGVEWNVRLSNHSTPSLLRKFEATFDAYWNSAEFERYDPDRDRDRIDDALLEASGRRGSGRVTMSLSGLEVRPYPYQQEMLEAIEAERIVHDRHRNLVVAATGTGKTVVAALVYRRLSTAAGGSYPSLLFVAHRKEILDQSV